MQLLASLSIVALALLGSAALPAAAQAPVVVRGIEIKGRQHVEESLLRDALTLKMGAPFKAEQVEADRKALLALGYFRRVAASSRTADGGATVTFEVAEFPRVAHLRVLNNTLVEKSALHRAISTERGQVLNAPRLVRDIAAIEQLYRDRGYVARVSEKLLDEAIRSGILRFEILEVRVDETVLEGGSPEVQERVRRALGGLPPGAAKPFYRPEEVAAQREKLLKLRGVERAEVRVETTDPGRVRVRWLLNEAAEPAKPAPETPGSPG